LSRLTTLRISDEDWDYIKKYGLKISHIFKLGLEQSKLEFLETARDELKKLYQRVYILEQKIYNLEQLNNPKNIYFHDKNIYNLEKVAEEFIKFDRQRHSDSVNLRWLAPRIKKLQKAGIIKTEEEVLEFCKNYSQKEGIDNV